MNGELERPNRAQWRHLHPYVYRAVTALAAWTIVAGWAFAKGPGYTAVALVVVTGFAIVFAGLPFLIWKLSRKKGDATSSSYQNWANGDLQICEGRIKAAEGAVLILTPVAAAAIGMTALVIVFRLVASGRI